MRGCLFCFTVEVTGNKNAKRRPEGRRFSHKTYKTRKTCFLSCRRANRLADGKPPVGWPTGGWPTGVLPEAALRLHRVVVGSPFQGFAAAMSSLHWPERWLGSMAASCVAGVPLCFTACLMSCAPTGLCSHCRFARPPKGWQEGFHTGLCSHCRFASLRGTKQIED